jgi:hypothetical protein
MFFPLDESILFSISLKKEIIKDSQFFCSVFKAKLIKEYLQNHCPSASSWTASAWVQFAHLLKKQSSTPIALANFLFPA